MKRILVVLGLLVGFSFASQANSYQVNDAAIDNLFANSTEIMVSSFNNLNPTGDALPVILEKENEAIIATIICWVVGGFGIHRHYLGTKKYMWAIYTFTGCGIFGIVPFVDFWVLLIDGVIQENVSKYQNNEKFFMWL